MGGLLEKVPEFKTEYNRISFVKLADPDKIHPCRSDVISELEQGHYAGGMKREPGILKEQFEKSARAQSE